MRNCMALVDIAPMSFLLILFFIVVSGFGSKPRKNKSKRTVRCICVVWCIGRNLEYHITLEGWNSFLILSCLSVFTTHVDAHSEQSLQELQILLKNMTPLLEVSKASLYAPMPSVQGCTKKLMLCYLLELNVILHEENGEEKHLSVIYDLIKHYNSANHCSMCSKCEAHSLANTTTFSQRMNSFVMMLLSKNNTSEFMDCD
ncbi:interleukin-15 [Silurus meridionalis]|uniref:Interleukin n=1 Tax=Silurus meridionalis TaxID=175797 RepID=A0A8T0BS37_SILME|nr:interleukin-15 [Silurus meridionalis]KAF7710112.1 hypothetical protein HF521_008984 [Silurus meridionalis]